MPAPTEFGLFALILSLFNISGQPAPVEPGDLIWQTEIDGQIWTPLHHNEGVLYFGSDNHSFYALDIERREILWETETGGVIRSGSASANGSVVFASDDGFLHSLSLDSGERQWRFDLGSADSTRILPAPGPPYSYDYLHSSPVYHEGHIYIGSASGRLFAIDQRTGEEAWHFQAGHQIRSTPVVHGNLVYFGSWDGHVYALDADTGEEVWRFQTGGVIQGSPAVGDGTVFTGSRSAAVFALDARTGVQKWKHVHADGSWVESSPVYRDGVVYVGTSDSLKLFAFDADTGQTMWEFTSGGWSWAKPRVENGTVYIGAISAFPYYVEGIDLKAGLFAVDQASGELNWEMTPKPIEGYLTGGVFATPVVVSGVVYVASLDGHLYALQE